MKIRHFAPSERVVHPTIHYTPGRSQEFADIAHCFEVISRRSTVERACEGFEEEQVDRTKQEFAEDMSGRGFPQAQPTAEDARRRIEGMGTEPTSSKINGN